MPTDPRDQNWVTDENGDRWLVDENGNYVTSGSDRVPGPARRLSDDEWLEFDDSQGHCAFCGSLTCRGGCFK